MKETIQLDDFNDHISVRVQYEPYLSTMKRRVYSFNSMSEDSTNEAKSFANLFGGTVTGRFIIV